MRPPPSEPVPIWTGELYKIALLAASCWYAWKVYHDNLSHIKFKEVGNNHHACNFDFNIFMRLQDRGLVRSRCPKPLNLSVNELLSLALGSEV